MTLDAQELLTELRARGVSIALTPEGKVRCTPRKKLTDSDISALMAHKKEVVSILLGGDNPPSPPSPPSPSPEKPLRTGLFSGDGHGDDATETVTIVTMGADEPPFVRKERERAEELGLVAKWSKTFGFISLHDPTTGEWHDLPTSTTPDWAKSEAFKRKELWKSGDRRAFDLTRAQIEEIWEEEHPPHEIHDLGIVEEHPLEEDD
jgi:hypothetical protein